MAKTLISRAKLASSSCAASGDHPEYLLALACAKHYAVHSGPERDRHRFNAEISDRDLYETYLPSSSAWCAGQNGRVMSATTRSTGFRHGQ